MEEKKNQIVGLAEQLLKKKQHEATGCVAEITHLAGDGSQRIFYRLQLSDGLTIVAVVPNEDSPLGRNEAESSWKICRHLKKAEISVPEPIAYDRKSGLILFEDLGDLRFHDLLGQKEYLRDDSRFALYREVLSELVRMQVKGSEGFDTSWCWQTPRYDRQLMKKWLASSTRDRRRKR